MKHVNETHITEEQFVLYYYGEDAPDVAGVENHLGECESCRSTYHSLQRVLNSVDSLPIPERTAEYETQVWNAVERQLPRRKSFAAKWLSWKPMLAAAAMVTLLVAAYVAGKSGRPVKGPQVADSQVRERILLVAVGDHLERSQTVLVELANAGAPKNGHLDISYEQQAAEDLLESNRLYRQTASSTGDTGTADMLEELERVLLEVAHSPSTVSEKQLNALRKQIEDQGILFKVKVFGSQVEQRQAAPTVGNGNAGGSSGASL
jgi:hypothetical protein